MKPTVVQITDLTWVFGIMQVHKSTQYITNVESYRHLNVKYYMLYTIATKLSRFAFVALEPYARLINWPMYMYK